MDPNGVFGGFCYKFCDATEGLEHSALCRKEFARVGMTKATALLPVELIVRQRPATKVFAGDFSSDSGSALLSTSLVILLLENA